MTQLSIDVARRPLTGALRDYNPFYLLSALCMLAGLLMLNDSLTWSPLPAGNLLWLILILNVYEFLLIGLGLFLFRRGLHRDAATLLVLEAFFLVDAGFLNSEIFAFEFELGLAVNLVLFVLAAVKLILIFDGLGIRLADPRLILALTQIFLLLALPGWFKHVSLGHGGSVPALTIYAAWWIVGFLPILNLMLLRSPASNQFAGVVGTFVLLPIVSILAHLGTSNWVYHVQWSHANVSPLLLGLAALIGASDYHVRNITARMRLHLLLPAVAIYLAIRHRPGLDFMLDDLQFTPLRLTLIGAALAYWQGLLIHRHPYFTVAGSLCLIGAGLGPTPSAISGNASSMSESIFNFLRRRVPRTVTQWGVVSIVGSFVSLGLGLILSLRRDAAKIEK